MKVLDFNEGGINYRYMKEIVDCLENGGIVIYPTDTIYAIGCDALNNPAIERICSLKAMKSAKTNLSIVCSDISEVAQYAKFDNNQFRAMKAHLPGPFTFIFPALSKLPKAFKGRRAVGIRIPDNAVAKAIVEALGRPILSTSVEGIDEDYRSEPELIAERYVNDVDIVVDFGRGGVIPSTVIDCTQGGFEIVRQGKGEFNF
ncbi:MAG: threonylcarbamoyl-AMP synthase [Muribaculaceae bacterium]|nr:threonylcarbamoyl-AMP synthase [Muribaculaceae bacterium]